MPFGWPRKESPKLESGASPQAPRPQAEEPSREVVLDDRERASGLDRELAEALGAPPAIERLPVGDVLVGRRYLIERKSAEDFAASIVDGRLFRQLAEMTAQRFEPILIVEGDFTEEIARRVDPAALRGAFLSAALRWRVTAIRSRSPRDTAQWIAALAQWGRAEGAPDFRRVAPDGRRRPATPEERRPRKRAVDPAVARRRREAAMLAQVEGIGRGRAEALLSKFGSFAGVAAASAMDLCEVEGIGRGLAERLREALAGPGAASRRAGRKTTDGA